MAAPIIIPITNTHVRECIIEAGKRASPQVFGFIMLGVLAFGLWMALWMWISEEFFYMSLAVFLGGAIGLPLLIGGLILAF